MDRVNYSITGEFINSSHTYSRTIENIKIMQFYFVVSNIISNFAADKFNY